MYYKLSAGFVPAACGIAALALAGLGPAHADVVVNGFSNETVNTGGTYTSVGVSNSGNTLTLTDGVGSEASSAFYNNLVPYSEGFTASFTYTDVGGGGADGFTFVMQNTGVNALGDSGGSLGYAGGPFDASFAFDNYIYSSSGVTVSSDNVNAGNSTTPVNLASGDPINIVISYVSATGSTTETLTDADDPADTFMYTSPYDLGAFVQGPTAYVGFTGGDGGFASTQDITNFVYDGVSPAPEPSQIGMLALVGLGIGGLLLTARKRAATGLA